MIGFVIVLAIIGVVIAGMWKAFEKAGQQGWACLVPIYNMIVLCRMAGKPGWWVLLMFIPIVNIVIIFLVMIEVSKNFGGGIGLTLLLVFLSFIAWPMLGFGDAKYQAKPATI